MMTLDEIRQHKLQLQSLARTYHIDPDSIRVFGSVAQGNADDDSDVDFLVRTLPECNLFDLAGFFEDASEILHHPVDVVSENSVPPSHPLLKEAILV